MTDWVGRWVNEYGSVVEITNTADGRLEGWFRTALEDSAFHGQDLAIAGTWSDDSIVFTASGGGRSISYTGALADGRLETMWTFVDGTVPWWRSALTNRDTFVRSDE